MVQRKEGIEWAESDIDWHINCLYCAVLYCTVCLQVRLLREGCHLQAVPGGHARPRHRQLPRGQPPLLDADPGQSLYTNIFCRKLNTFIYKNIFLQIKYVC